jgi:hypothetical protein
MPRTNRLLRRLVITPTAAVVAVTACSEHAASPASVLVPGAEAAAARGPTDPSATWKIPLSDASLGLRSDHLYSDGTNSLYADGVCRVTAAIYATSNASGSGDAVMSTNVPGGKCVRRFTLVYPDGYTETVGSFNNLSLIENSSYSIPIDSTVERQLHFAPDNIVSNPSRCGVLIFGYGVMNNIAVGSDSLLVTRVNASTWHVVSQAPPHNLAYCKNDGQLYAIPVDFTVVSSYPLP